MRRIAKPVNSPEEVFRICISRIRDAGLKNRLESCEAKIIASSQEFENKVVNGKLHTIPTSNNISGIVTVEEMQKVYSNRMVRKSSPGRPVYDKLMALPVHGRCPLCGQRIVSTLDHHLPKAYYPALAVSPINLVPACKDCNFLKKDKVPQTGEQETIHPYFDDIEGDFWLKCDVIEESLVSFIFYASPPLDWDNQLSKRIKYHFNVLKLAELYASHAAEEFANIYSSLKIVFDAGGKKATMDHLKDSALSRSGVFKNSWQTAMYKSMASNDWFCSGGFLI